MPTGPGTRLSTLRRERELSSAGRAGSWSRRRARELQYAYVRLNWMSIFGIAAVAMAATPATLLLPPDVRSFVLGAWIAAVTGMLVHWVVVDSGSISPVMGDRGEQWTRAALRTARRDGWKVVHRVLLRGDRDIDTVAIGSPGIVVIETKWSSTDWASPNPGQWIKKAAKQVGDNRRDTELHIRSRRRQLPV